MAKKARKIYRDSATGQFTKKANVKRRPKSTQTETVPVRKRRK